jgi:hypothetical protein
MANSGAKHRFRIRRSGIGELSYRKSEQLQKSAIHGQQKA